MRLEALDRDTFATGAAADPAAARLCMGCGDGCFETAQAVNGGKPFGEAGVGIDEPAGRALDLVESLGGLHQSAQFDAARVLVLIERVRTEVRQEADVVRTGDRHP